jgi:hypothetical protein
MKVFRCVELQFRKNWYKSGCIGLLTMSSASKVIDAVPYTLPQGVGERASVATPSVRIIQSRDGNVAHYGIAPIVVI